MWISFDAISFALKDSSRLSCPSGCQHTTTKYLSNFEGDETIERPVSLAFMYRDNSSSSVDRLHATMLLLLQANQTAPADPNGQQQQTSSRNSAVGLLRDFTPLKKLNSPAPSVGPEEQLVGQVGEQEEQPSLELGLLNTSDRDKCAHARSELTPNAIKVDVIDQAEVDTSLSEVDIDTSSEDSLAGPAAVDQENVFFMGDEVGELALGHFDGGDYYDAVWSFGEEEDKSEGRQKSDIRRSIAKSITPRSNPYSLSPRGLDGELKVAVEWREQQQIHRQQSFKHNTTVKLGDDIESMENHSPRWWRHESPAGLDFTTDSDTDEYELYPDTPAQKAKALAFSTIRIS